MWYFFVHQSQMVALSAESKRQQNIYKMRTQDALQRLVFQTIHPASSDQTTYCNRPCCFFLKTFRAQHRNSMFVREKLLTVFFIEIVGTVHEKLENARIRKVDSKHLSIVVRSMWNTQFVLSKFSTSEKCTKINRVWYRVIWLVLHFSFVSQFIILSTPHCTCLSQNGNHCLFLDLYNFICIRIKTEQFARKRFKYQMDQFKWKRCLPSALEFTPMQRYQSEARYVLISIKFFQTF